jgi:hypothetical protein
MGAFVPANTSMVFSPSQSRRWTGMPSQNVKGTFLRSVGRMMISGVFVLNSLCGIAASFLGMFASGYDQIVLLARIELAAQVFDPILNTALFLPVSRYYFWVIILVDKTSIDTMSCGTLSTWRYAFLS